MTISAICNHEVITVKADATIFEAAKLMRSHHVGDVVVINESQGKPIPLGIVTDRDLVIEVVATELDCKVMTVSDIMVRHLSVVTENAGVFETIKIMTSKGVRRLPVVDEHGMLTGIVTLDDLLILLSNEIGSLSKLVSRELKNEASSRR
ncbi:CBS domain-containing protein [Methylotenera mobilis]|jgi:CBS domain-containing protein|uniref:CBS domain-containing protein n=1 Tax=Methylotenera mobilis TaxID=359408 RepID=UPI000375ECB9|nr:CBS domain-containing protein [Methylotenera mobilis]PPC96999.1 MAG: CBS domain-containing protein [Methylotenera sp.]